MKDTLMGEEKIILEKIDQFIRKFYKNKILKGLLLSLAIIASTFLIISFSEYWIHFGRLIRTLLFFFFITLFIIILILFIGIPFLRLLKIGKTLDYLQAAKIIGIHFREIEDKLLNTLQLVEEKNKNKDNLDLLVASINQKINTLNPFKFKQVIQFRNNLPYLKYVIPPVLIIFTILLLAPGIISEPAKNIIRFDDRNADLSPFRIKILNNSLKAMQQDDYQLKVKIFGDIVPDQLFIKNGSITYRMNKEKPFLFTYVFKSLQTNVLFYLFAGEIRSEEYEIEVFPRPILLNFDLTLKFPDYLLKEKQIIENSGDICVPEGTEITWNLYTTDVTQIEMIFDREQTILKKEKSNVFKFTKKVFKSGKYSIVPSNSYSAKSEPISYQVQVIQDAYPSIVFNETSDSILTSTVFCDGIIRDDYGFSKLIFHYEKLQGSENRDSLKYSVMIPIEKRLTSQVFYYNFDLTSFLFLPGEKVLYYFEVFDNDAIHGPKSTKSEIKIIRTKSIEEIKENTEKKENEVISEMENSNKETKSISKSLEELSRKMIDKNSIDWQEKLQIEEQVQSFKKITESIEKIKKKNTENIINEEKFLETGERIIEKQKLLNDMMDQLLSEELKEMIRELKDMINKVDREKLNQLMEKMKISTKELENQLDKNINLFKNIELNRKIEEKIKEIKKLGEKQEKLSKDTENEQNQNNLLLKHQDTLRKQFDSLTSDLKNIEKVAEEISNPFSCDKTLAKQEEIKSLMDKSKENLQKNKRKKASQVQNESAKKINEMAEILEKIQNEAEQNQYEEDSDNIRKILENLIRLSFKQEDIMYLTKTMARNDPKMLELIDKQKEIGEKILILKDSLNAIAKRQVYIKPIINREINYITKNVKSAVEELTIRAIGEVLTKQQLVMTSINNLALLLNEALEKMNQNMDMKGNGQSTCQKPSKKGGKKSINSIKEMQEELGKKLNDLKNAIENLKPGEYDNKVNNSMINKELAKLAAQQEAIRREVQKYQENMMENYNKESKAEIEKLNETINEMEQNEKALINKTINQEAINRQQKIMTRLLESEKAEQSRGKEEKRESTEAKTQKTSNPEKNFEYNKQKSKGIEILKTEPPPINNYYKAKINNYRIKIEQ